MADITEDADQKSKITAFVYIIILMGLTGLVVFFLLGTIGIGNDIEDTSTTDTTGDSGSTNRRTPSVVYRLRTIPRPAPPPTPAPATLAETIMEPETTTLVVVPPRTTEETTTQPTTTTLPTTTAATLSTTPPTTTQTTPPTTRETTTVMTTTTPATSTIQTAPTTPATTSPTTPRTIPTTAPRTIPSISPANTTIGTTRSITQSTTAMTSSGTTSAQPPVKPLVCTVGYSATAEFMYPPDRYCDYLYYCNVIVRNRTLRAAKSEVSWQVFQNQTLIYQRVRLGLSFHFGHITLDQLNEAEQNLTSLRQKNVQQYGMLNVRTNAFRLRGVVNRLKDIFRKMKSIQDDPNARTVIAIGLRDFSEPNAWKTYKEVITTVVDTYMVDIVIATSSVSIMENAATCYAAPPVAIRVPTAMFPSLIQHAELVAPLTRYTKPNATVGLSYQLGALIYVLPRRAPDPATIPYMRCVSLNLSSVDVICARGQPHRLNTYMSHSVAGYVNSSEKIVFLSETQGSFENTITALTTTGVFFRQRMAWLLFDVHLQDHTGACVPKNKLLEDVCRSFKGSAAC